MQIIVFAWAFILLQSFSSIIVNKEDTCSDFDELF